MTAANDVMLHLLTTECRRWLSIDWQLPVNTAEQGHTCTRRWPIWSREYCTILSLSKPRQLTILSSTKRLASVVVLVQARSGSVHQAAPGYQYVNQQLLQKQIKLSVPSRWRQNSPRAAEGKLLYLTINIFSTNHHPQVSEKVATHSSGDIPLFVAYIHGSVMK